jgi:hypothetical protein
MGYAMAKSEILYLDEPGGKNTDKVLGAVVERLREGDIKHVVVASDSGKTGLKAVRKLKGLGAKIVVVTEMCGSENEGEDTMAPETEEQLLDAGAKVLRGTHALSGVERSINKKIGGSSRVETISEALRSLFGQGMKVAVEITIMAADNGAIPCGRDAEVVAIGGTEWGSDTAVVVRPAHSNGFFNLRVREIIAIPRKR